VYLKLYIRKLILAGLGGLEPPTLTFVLELGRSCSICPLHLQFRTELQAQTEKEKEFLNVGSFIFF